MKHDKKRAFEYRKETLGDEIPEEYRDKPTVPISKEEIKEKLKSAWVKFSHLLWEEKLKELLIQNNLA